MHEYGTVRLAVADGQGGGGVLPMRGTARRGCGADGRGAHVQDAGDRWAHDRAQGRFGRVDPDARAHDAVGRGVGEGRELSRWAQAVAAVLVLTGIGPALMVWAAFAALGLA